MITLTSDKSALVKAGFSIRGLIYQGLRWSTPWQMDHPGVFATPGKVV
jgi:hypothetical protein